MTTQLPGATWTSSHIYGQGQKNIVRKLAYYHIPKCASMWMRLYLSLHGRASPDDIWVPTSFVDEPLDDYMKIFVLRDPVERWISNCPAVGVIDQITQNADQTNVLFEHLAEWLYDEHAAAQFDFINGCNISSAVWFRCDSNLSHNVQEFFCSQRFSNYAAPAIVNQQSQDESTKKSAEIWRQLLKTPKYFEKFKTVYQKDYDLIDAVTFYGQP